jgi:hypothetical protein
MKFSTTIICLFYITILSAQVPIDIGAYTYSESFALNGTWTSGDNKKVYISVSGNEILVDMAAYNRPIAKGVYIDNKTINVNFADFKTTVTGTLQTNKIIWSNGSQWTRIFELNGTWTAGDGKNIPISVSGNDISVDMSAYNRPIAKGVFLNATTISINFADVKATVTGTLNPIDNIVWSNGTKWLKLNIPKNAFNTEGDWGGGEDYPRIVSFNTKMDGKSARVIYVKDSAGLKNALNIARSGQTVYVDDKVEIDLTGFHDLSLNEGVTLASGRGKNGSLGALLFCTNKEAFNLFNLTTNNIRITGLRLKGPDPHEDKQDGETGNAGCIRIGEGFFKDEEWGSINDIKNLNIEIDNNDIWAWPGYCVGVSGVSGVAVRYNYLHNNLKDYDGHGAGYGVVVGPGHVLVEKNIFSYNRHDIACGGHPLSNYTFRNNLVLHGGTHHSIDVHGWFEAAKITQTIKDASGKTIVITIPDPAHRRTDGTCYAGNNFIVEGNVVLQDFNFITSLLYAYNVLIRGIPEGSVQIRRNKFAQHKGVTIGQTPKGGLDVVDRFWNVFDHGLFSKSRINIADDNDFYLDYPNGLFISYSGTDYWKFRKFEPLPIILTKTVGNAITKTTNMLSGDFDGDGKDDLFYADGQKWFVSNKAKGDFQEICQANVRLNELQLGDFNGDGKTDVMYKNENQLYYANAGKTLWSPLCATTDKISDLRLGDFNGDGKTDIFHKKGGNWEVSYGGVSAWTPINTSDASVSDLLFGDFNGDKKTDVLWVHDGKWLVSWSGNTGWAQINTAGMPITSLRVGDFNGDGQDDLFKEEGREWFVSWSGRTRWDKINSSGYDLADFIFGDFNGDKKKDVMVSFNDWR